MNTYWLDGNNFTDKSNANAEMIRAFGFPDWFGRNLETSRDLMVSLEPSEIHIDHAREIVKNLNDYGITLLDLFADLKEAGYRVHIHW